MGFEPAQRRAESGALRVGSTMNRLIVQLSSASAPLPARIAQLLQEAGATDVRPSHQELPGLYVATVPDLVDVADLLAKLEQEPEVRHAELETFRSTT